MAPNFDIATHGRHLYHLEVGAAVEAVLAWSLMQYDFGDLIAQRMPGSVLGTVEVFGLEQIEAFALAIPAPTIASYWEVDVGAFQPGHQAIELYLVVEI